MKIKYEKCNNLDSKIKKKKILFEMLNFCFFLIYIMPKISKILVPTSKII